MNFKQEQNNHERAWILVTRIWIIHKLRITIEKNQKSWSSNIEKQSRTRHESWSHREVAKNTRELGGQNKRHTMHLDQMRKFTRNETGPRMNVKSTEWEGRWIKPRWIVKNLLIPCQLKWLDVFLIYIYILFFEGLYIYI